jgi:hypothetical protein
LDGGKGVLAQCYVLVILPFFLGAELKSSYTLDAPRIFQEYGLKASSC